MPSPKSLESLEQQRADIAKQIAALGDLRGGSITSTTGRCGKPNCHCHQPKDPRHGPNLRLTYKVDEFRRLQSLHKEFVEVNAQVCQLRPPEPDAMAPEEKKRPKPSKRRSPAK